MQQNAAPAEISAAGQLVMLTQRIGKSANEFLTIEGVSPEAVFLLGKDLNSFKEIAQGLLDGSPEQRLPGSEDPQTRERLEALMKTVRTDAHASRRHSGQPARPGGRARSAGGDHCRQRTAAPLAWRPAGQALRADRPRRRRADGPGACRRSWPSLCAVGPRPTCSCGRPQAPAAAEAQRLEAEQRSRKTQARQRRQPGGHFAADERTADSGRRRPDAGSHGDRGHHGRHRRLGELHGGRTAPAGGQRAEHGDARGADDVAGGKHVDRTAGRVDRAAARDSRNRPVGARRWPSESTGVRASAGVRHGGAPVAASRDVGPRRPCRTRSAA